MHIYHKDDVVSPLVSDHGEIVYELIGRTVGEQPERHSIAYVVIPPTKYSSLHHHPEAEASYYILRGQARMVLGDKEAIVGPGQAILIPRTRAHKIFNVGEQDLELLAICAPAWEPSNSVWLE